MTITYVRVTAADAALDATGVEAYQAGEWHAVEHVVVKDGYASVRFVEGGSSAAPAHFFTLRRMVTR